MSARPAMSVKSSVKWRLQRKRSASVGRAFGSAVGDEEGMNEDSLRKVLECTGGTWYCKNNNVVS